MEKITPTFDPYGPYISWVKIHYLEIVIAAGVALIIFADPLSTTLVAKQAISPNGFLWSTDDAREISLNCRWDGVMLLAIAHLHLVIRAINGLGTRTAD